MIAAYDKMDKALKATGRPIVYSLCQYGWDAVWEWGPSVGGKAWRTTGDIQPNWNSIYTILNQQAGLAKYAGPGHWNDPDMLEVGNGQPGAGGQIRIDPGREPHALLDVGHAGRAAAGRQRPAKHDAGDTAMLMNRDVIAIDQDQLGHEATRAYSDGELDVWTRHLSGGAMAIAVINAGSDRYSTHPFHLNLAKLGLHGPQKGKDLWTGKDVTLNDNMPVELASHDILLVRIAVAEVGGTPNVLIRSADSQAHRKPFLLIRPGGCRREAGFGEQGFCLARSVLVAVFGVNGFAAGKVDCRIECARSAPFARHGLPGAFPCVTCRGSTLAQCAKACRSKSASSSRFSRTRTLRLNAAVTPAASSYASNSVFSFFTWSTPSRKLSPLFSPARTRRSRRSASGVQSCRCSSRCREPDIVRSGLRVPDEIAAPSPCV